MSIATTLIDAMGEFIKAGQWREAADFLRLNHLFVPQDDAFKMLKQSAAIYEERCSDLERANECLEAALEFNPNDESTRTALNRVTPSSVEISGENAARTSDNEVPLVTRKRSIIGHGWTIE